MASKGSGGADVARIFAKGTDDERVIIKKIDQFVNEHGLTPLDQWHAPAKNKNSFLHELAELKCYDALQYAVKVHRLDGRVHRSSDGKSLLEMLKEKKAPQDVIEFFEKFYKKTPASYGDDGDNQDDDQDNKADDDDDDDDDDDRDAELRKKMNIVWMDLEMTSIEKPEIMECAIIITDRNLNELVRGEWVVHYDEQVLKSLGEWHQNQFKAKEEGGNDLFRDCLQSKSTEREVEVEVLKLLRRFCPEGECPLAGSSIHIDRDVLRQRMPEVFKYLHYRIIDVSSFRAMLKRWKPARDADFVSQLAHGGQENVNHRAMDDIEWSIALMKLYRPMLTGRPERSENRSSRPLPPRNNAVNHGADAVRGPRIELYSDEKTLQERMDLEKNYSAKLLGLHSADRQTYEQNPHLREVFINRRRLETFKGKFEGKHRLLDPGTGSSVPSSPSTPGGASSMPAYTTEHWGARKTCLIDIEFLTNYVGDKEATVLYIGAAPGFHIPVLSTIFPKLTFILLDSKTIEAKVTKQIKINSMWKVDEVIRSLKKLKQPVFFICNVRTSSTAANIENDIRQDLENQRKWHRDIDPEASLLTFRVDRNSSKTRFYQGDFVIEPWSSRRSTDCRLVVRRGASTVDHDNRRISVAMSCFQNVARTMYYEHNIDETKSNGLDHCYDCRAEIRILAQFLKKIRGMTDDAKVFSNVPKLSSMLSQEIQDPTQPTFIGGQRTLDIIK